MKASDYKVTHPYGATYPPWSRQHPHTGEDRPTPLGTLVDVGDTIIGLTGSTGKSSAPHLHTQKYKSRFLDPKGAGLANTIDFPAIVSETGDDPSEKGKYVRLVDAKNYRWSYFHLSKVRVFEGQVIKEGGEEMPTRAEIKEFFRAYLNTEPTERQYKLYESRPWSEMAHNVAGTLRNTLVSESAKVTKAAKEVEKLKKLVDSKATELKSGYYIVK